MNPMLQKLIDQDFMGTDDANYLEKAIANKDTIIISGHRGHGILPLLASLGAVAQGSGLKVKPVRNPETDLDDTNADYFMIGDLKDTDYTDLLVNAFSKKGQGVIVIKDADHSFSVMKIVSDVFKATGDSEKVYQLVECTKENDVKMLKKMVKLTLNEKGRPVRTPFEK